VDEAADRAAVLVELMKLRHDGLRCDTDYAGRSAKGQMTQAGRLGARIVVRVEGETATLRSGGEDLGGSFQISEIAERVRGTPAHHPL
jgi:histidyl-tRNA synthetase